MSCCSGVKSLVSISKSITLVNHLPHKFKLNIFFPILGINKDYYIALAITYEGQFEFPHKRFYWCLSDDFTFKETPELNDQHREFIDKDGSFFMGEPNRKLK